VYLCRRGGCIFIRPGAFRTMEHLLAMRVSLPAAPLSVGQATIIFFIKGSDADVWVRHFFKIETCCTQLLYPINRTKNS
jgi:hypothetical protein